MTPKEKAEKLTDSFLTASFGVMEEYIPVPYPFAKQCALIAVDEVLETLDSPPIRIGNESHMLWKATVDYWREVKQEIEKL